MSEATCIHECKCGCHNKNKKEFEELHITACCEGKCKLCGKFVVSMSKHLIFCHNKKNQDKENEN